MRDAKIVLSAVDQTKATFEQAKRNLSSIGDQVGRLDARFGALGGAIVAAFTAASFKGALDMLDHLDDLSEKTGISVESLSALRYAGEVTGTSLESLADGTRKLANNMADAAGGGKETSATFKALGVSVKDSTGALRSSDAVLLDLADRFSKFEDGPAKAALAVRVFGKAGADMIPLLNQGSAGIRKLRDEADGLGLIFSADVARAAAAFNDNLKKLELSSAALKVEIAGGLLPAVNKLIEGFLRLKAVGQVWTVIKDAAKGIVGMNKLTSDPGSDINALMAEREAIRQQIAGREAYAKRIEGGTPFQRKQALNARADVRDFEKDIFDIDQLLEVSRIRQAGRVLDGPASYSNEGARAAARVAAPIVAGGEKTEKVNKDLEQQRKLLAELAGLSGSFAEDWDNLSKVFAKGGLNLEQLTKAQADLLAKQPAMKAAADAQTKSEKELQEAREKAAGARQKWLEDWARENEQRVERNKSLREEIEEIGLTAEALGRVRLQRIDNAIAIERENVARLKAIEGAEDELAAAERRLALIQEERGLTQSKILREKDTTEVEENKKRSLALSESIEEGILTGFRNGSSFADVFINELKAQFAKTVLRPVIQPIAEAGSAALGGLFKSVFGGLLSFDGGGSTGNGPRSGGLDGKGGFMAMVHPRESVVDHTKGQSVGGMTVVQNFTVGDVATVSMVRNAVRQSQAQGMAALGRSRNYGGTL